MNETKFKTPKMQVFNLKAIGFWNLATTSDCTFVIPISIGSPNMIVDLTYVEFSQLMM